MRFISEAERERRRQAQIDGYRRKHPKRWAMWHRAMLNPQPCDTCGGEGRPHFEPPPSLVQVGWRCYACRS